MPPKKTSKKQVKKLTKPHAAKLHTAATKVMPKSTKAASKSKQSAPKKTFRGKQEPPFKILVFSKTTAYRHASIPAGIRGLQRLADEVSVKTRTPFTVEATEDAAIFDRPRKLSTFKVIVLLSNSGDDCLNEQQLKNFQKWVEKGGGVVGIHCATFACTGGTCSNGQGDEWYGNMLGGVFEEHPEPQTARVRIVVEGPDSDQEEDSEDEEDEFHLVKKKKKKTTKGKEKEKEKSKGRPFHMIHISAEIDKEHLLKDWGKSVEESESNERAGEEYATTSSGYKERTSFLWHDEWYNFKTHPREKLNQLFKNGTTEDFTILLKVDESTYTGGKHGEDHPIAWCQQFPAPKTAEERKQERKHESMMNWLLEHHGQDSYAMAGYLTEQEQKKKEEEKRRRYRKVSEMGGRCFYTSLGHFDEAYEDPWFMGHVLAGIHWAAKV
ncbi:Trehalose utilization domain containing protein [Naviculisporaceae sp. PSN 640]